MSKIEYRRMPAAERSALEKEIRRMLGRFHMNEEGQKFLISLLTDSEIVMIGRRLRVVSKLYAGERPMKIAREMKISPITIRALYDFAKGESSK
ncbi:MAG: hypothetical protein AAB489_03775 [Patescibacteria group bacterium]